MLQISVPATRRWFAGACAGGPPKRFNGSPATRPVNVGARYASRLSTFTTRWQSDLLDVRRFLLRTQPLVSAAMSRLLPTGSPPAFLRRLRFNFSRLGSRCELFVLKDFRLSTVRPEGGGRAGKLASQLVTRCQWSSSTQIEPRARSFDDGKHVFWLICCRQMTIGQQYSQDGRPGRQFERPRLRCGAQRAKSPPRGQSACLTGNGCTRTASRDVQL